MIPSAALSSFVSAVAAFWAQLPITPLQAVAVIPAAASALSSGEMSEAFSGHRTKSGCSVCPVSIARP